MTEIRKRVDESWKEQVEREKQKPAPQPQPKRPEATPSPAAGPAPEPPVGGPPQTPPMPEVPAEPGENEVPEARFDMFVSGLAMEALIALGEMAHPVTRRTSVNFPQAKYLIDLIGLLEQKTQGNLTPEESHLLRDTLYQLRMRYLSRAGAP